MDINSLNKLTFSDRIDINDFKELINEIINKNK
jgi:hypothetical protein